MSFIHTNRRHMLAFAAARKRAVLTGGAALALVALSACNKDQILSVNNPDILQPGVFSTPSGTDPLRFGVISDFTLAFDGNTDSYTTMSGDMADELLASDTFNERLSVNNRNPVEINSSTESVYRNLQQAHLGATKATVILAAAQPTQKWQRGEMYMLRGYTELFLAEGFCSGSPFSSADDNGNVTYGKANPTADIFTMANASFDSALALADTSQRVKYGSQIGKARALLNLAQYPAAATAATGVPRSFQLFTFHSTGVSREENGMWNASANGSSRYMIVTSEGINGLPYLATSTDPRIPWVPSTRIGFDGNHTKMPTETKFARTTNGLIGDGTEAALDVLEARLQGGAQADRDAVFAGLNNLRATNSPAIPAMAGSAPTDQASAVNQYFAERAYWSWLTGHRLGDMRRLARNYGRNTETVFPTGSLAGDGFAGNFGPATSMIIPFNEKNNPNFKGCIDLKP
jgi:hypothetical protein